MVQIDDVLDWARTQQPLVAVSIFCVVNILSTSVFPIPLGVWMMLIAGILYGQVLGLALYLSTCLLGAWITFGVTRLIRPRIIAMLGEHADTWRRLDTAITREGLWIALLWRVAPIAPFVVSSAMIAMTDIAMHDYLWTTALGIIPSSFPIVSGAALAGTMLIEHRQVSKLTLGINIASVAAGVYVMVRLGAIAVEVLRRDVAENESSSGSTDDSACTDSKAASKAGGVGGAGGEEGRVAPPRSPAEKSFRASFDVISRQLSSGASLVVAPVVDAAAEGVAAVARGGQTVVLAARNSANNLTSLLASVSPTISPFSSRQASSTGLEGGGSRGGSVHGGSTGDIFSRMPVVGRCHSSKGTDGDLRSLL